MEGWGGIGIMMAVAIGFGIVSVMQEVVAYQRKRMSDHGVIDLS